MMTTINIPGMDSFVKPSKNHRLVTLRLLVFVATAFNSSAALASQTQVVAGASKTHPEVWAVQASAGLEPRVIDALKRILSADRRLLALRGYLRAGDSLAQRWSWSQEQLSNYPATLEGRAAAADIDAVVAAFAAANPGFTLRVNRKLRSLEVQIAHWNVAESVGTAAAVLVAALEQRFIASTPNTDQLRQALIEWKPDVATALAAPGLSAHGQGRAFDFQVERDGQVIAGIDVTLTSQQWDAAGWTQKLRAAVSVAGNHFSGPLESPYEPWHYAYAPRPATSDGTRAPCGS
jgi:D-alanyl-D-alanine carboxypeptidase